MEWIFLALLLLAFPVIAIIALVKAQANAGELHRLGNQLNSVQRDLRALTARLDADAPPAAARPSAPEAAPGPIRREPASETAAPVREAAPSPKPPASPPPAASARGLEESLTSRWFVWLGAVAVALAGTFLVKYAIDNGWLGPAMRCSLGLLLGLSLAAAGEWLRRRPFQKAFAAIHPDYVPPSLTASGLFIAFTSIYAAYALYALLSPLAALLALAAVALLAVGLSLLQGMFVALMGVLGGFVTPALIVTPSPSAWGLFGYLLVILAAALAVARFRGWWWLALATLAGAAFWPVAWMLGPWHASDEIPLGIYLLLTAIAFFFVRRGWESPEGSRNWLEDIRALHQPERVVWIAGCLIALLLLLVVDSAGYNPTALVLFGVVAALYLVAGRREGIFDALPVVVAAAALIIVTAMPLPGHVTLSLRPHAPLVPAQLSFYISAALAFGALFGAGGFVALWGAKRPAIWAGVSAGVPVLILTIAYWRIVDLHVDFAWAGIALALAALCLVAAERVERHRAALGDALGLYAAGVVAFLSLAATMSLREAWLTVALSLQLPMLSWIHQRIAVRPIRVLAAIVAGTVLIRLVLNYDVLSYALSGTPLLNWVLYGYGIPALSFFTAAYFFRKTALGLLVTLLDAGGLAFFVLLVSLQIRIAVSGSLGLPEYRLLEESLQSISWLAIGSVLALHHQRRANPVSFYGSRILLGLAALQIVLLQLLAANPVVTHEFIGNWPVIDLLFLAYAVPAAFAFGLSVVFNRGGEREVATAGAIAGFVLLFVYISLEVRHAFQGPILQQAVLNDSELYTYSIVWLIYAVALLALGIVFKQAMLRYASLAILVVVALKVFLLDMGDLSGLYRVGSFLGLGLSLVGIGLVYQRFVFPRPAP
ncbi:MAG TPA: DUF2339 domain-containing protein [Rhizomicrobium sp.]